MKHKKLILILAVLLFLVLAGAILFFPYIMLARTVSGLNDMLESCSFDVEYTSRNMEWDDLKFAAAMKTVGLNIDSGKISGQKVGSVFYAEWFPEQEEEPLVQLYADSDDVRINLFTAYECVRNHVSLGILSLFLPDLSGNHYYVSLSDILAVSGDGDAWKDFYERMSDTGNGMKTILKHVFGLHRCQRPEDARYVDQTDNMYFFEYEDDGGTTYIIGITKNVKKDSLVCYLQISRGERVLEGLLRLQKQENISLEMPESVELSDWQIKFIEWLTKRD